MNSVVYAVRAEELHGRQLGQPSQFCTGVCEGKDQWQLDKGELEWEDQEVGGWIILKWFLEL
jgi:hypothetical protein